MANAINRITCYWKDGTWCFDDPPRNLLAEPFVGGADLILSYLGSLKGATNKDKLILTFSANPFPGAEQVFIRKEPEHGGCWYSCEGQRGWLCPALFKYFDYAPAKIHLLVDKA